MKKFMIVCFVMVFGLFITSASLAGGHEAEVAANVDKIVEQIDGGKAPTEFQAQDYDPYIYIMEEDGKLLVHPTLQGQSLGDEQYKPVYDAITQATRDGVWVEYEWAGGPKKAYVRETEGGLIVGSGFSKE
jgi:hypothetical protein